MIDFERVTKLYRTVIGVNDISLQIGPGAHGLLGPNGAGKTTFLNLVTGQLTPTQGTVRVFGNNPHNHRDVLRRLGVCPGDEALYANVTGLEWVRYLVELHGFDSAPADRRARAALDRVGMTHAMRRTIGTYSRGMRQRTKIAQAIAHDPDLLILDEPFNGLDPVARHTVTRLLKEWIDDGGSLILASHILHEVEAITSRFLLIANGRLLATGTADEVGELLPEAPSEIVVRSRNSRELAERIIGTGLAVRIRFDETGVVSTTTRDPRALLEQLPRWGREGLDIQEIRSTGGSLQSVFDALLDIQRGKQL